MYNYNYRTKFGSQTFDNMDRWKRKERWEESEKRRAEARRSEKAWEERRCRRAKKVGKSRLTVFPMICVSGRSKSRLAKAAGAKPCGQMRDEKLHTVKTYKTHQGGSIFGSCDVQKVHAVLARSTSPSQNVQNIPGWEHFWKLWCPKSARRCGAEHMSKSKCTKHTKLGALLEVEMSKKYTLLLREAHFEVKSVKNWRVRSTFGRSDVVSPGRRKGLWHLKRICKDAFRVGGAVQKTCSSEMLGGQGADFLRMAVFWSIRSSGLLRWFCVTGQAQHFVWPVITFSWQVQYFRDMGRKNCKSHWYQGVSSALNFPWLKEVSQNCFVFDVANFKNWGGLAELLRFWCCQLQKFRKSPELFRFWRCQVQN